MTVYVYLSVWIQSRCLVGDSPARIVTWKLGLRSERSSLVVDFFFKKKLCILYKTLPGIFLHLSGWESVFEAGGRNEK